MSPKPVYERMRELIKGQWWTKTAGRTSAAGEFKVTAFHGTQRITVRDSGGKEASREIAWRRVQPNQVAVFL